MSYKHRIVNVSAVVFLAAACGTTVATEQLPATAHQAEVVKAVEPRRAAASSMTSGIPATAHQDSVLRGFEAADLDRDGVLSHAEYAAYMEHRAAVLYDRSLVQPERHGTDGTAPRERTATDGAVMPLPTADPTVGE